MVLVPTGRVVGKNVQDLFDVSDLHGKFRGQLLPAGADDKKIESCPALEGRRSSPFAGLLRGRDRCDSAKN